jgi:hypothetical protein
MLPSRSQGFSAAAQSLGLGDGLSQQVKDETEEERKKRLARAQQMSLLGPAAMSLGLDGTGGLGA